MRVSAAILPLRWSERKTAAVEHAVRSTDEGSFVHWTQKSQLHAVNGDRTSARACLDHVLSQWGEHHTGNNHFLAEVSVAAALIGDFELIYALFRDHLGTAWTFEIEAVEGLSEIPYVFEWEVVSRTHSVFRFDVGTYASDAAHHIFLSWVWSHPLFDGYHRSPLAVAGRTAMTLGDMGAATGLAFSANRPDAFLVPDTFFMAQNGYEHKKARLDAARIPWADRRPVVFWRGTTTGLRTGDWRTLQRVRFCQVARDQGRDWLYDVGISSAVQLRATEAEELAAAGLTREFVPSDTLGVNKYQVDIDGNSNSWEGLFVKLYTGSPVLKVASAFGFRQWYYDRLQPWVNHVPVEADLSDLAENVAWLRTHDDAAELIGKRGHALARSMTRESEISNAVPTVVEAMRFFRDERRLPPIACAGG